MSQSSSNSAQPPTTGEPPGNDTSQSSQKPKQERFLELYDQLVAGKETWILSETQYADILDAVIRKNYGEKITVQKERNWVRRFFLKTENGQSVLFRGGGEGSGRVVKRSELFKLLQASHEKLLHGGRDVMYRDLADYSGITKATIMAYLSLCRECELKRAKVKKGITVKPILSEGFNARCQVDLIDFQSRPDGDYKFVLNYQDHFTKFLVLRPLKRKSMHDVVAELMQIFATIGAPRILQSDNGKV